MNRIKNAFTRGKAFVAFITCGDPDLETTAAAVREAAANGADMVELGIPFSDSTVDGEVVQTSNLRALAKGVTTDKIFAMVENLRQEVRIPLLFMTYANVIFSYGIDKFISKCSEVGIDGIIVPDLPFEEKEEFQPACCKYGVKLISVVSLTSDERISMIVRKAEGFIHLASNMDGVNVKQVDYEKLELVMKKIRCCTELPCVIGLEDTEFQHAKTIAGLADGLMVDNVIVKLMAEYGVDAAKRVGEYVAKFKQCIN